MEFLKNDTPRQMLGILLTTLIFIGVMIGSTCVINIADVKNNWEKYRCRPDVMFMAPIYGQNAASNLEYCLKNGFDKQASGAIAPFYTFMGSFASTLVALLGSINSIKMTFATIIGSSNTVFNEFSSRIKALFYRIQMTAIRMKFMMSRIFGMMYSIMFMGMSGIKAGTNLGRTPLFDLLNAICFDPDTPIVLKRGRVPIKDIKIGDIFAAGDTVTAVFEFQGDGQEMVNLGGIRVSTNHYVKYKNVWIEAGSHPDAIPIGAWEGPLICLNTNTQSFHIGNYLFRDYDGCEPDKKALDHVLKMLNGSPTTSSCTSGIMGFGSETIFDNVPAKHIQLGTVLKTGTVCGVVQNVTDSFCLYKNTRLAPGTAVWSEEKECYLRASDLADIQKLPTPEIFWSFVVFPFASLETSNDLIIRDYLEIHDPDLAIFQESFRNSCDAQPLNK